MLEVRDARRLSLILERLLEALMVYQSGFSIEGGTAEGVAYWLYGFGYFTYFSEMLRERTNGAFDLLETERARAIAGFPTHLHLSGDAFVNFADAPEHCPLHSGLSSRLNQRLNLGLPNAPSSFHRDHCYRWGHISRNLFWTTPERSVAPTPRVSWLPDLGVLVARGEGTVFAAKGGHNAEPHNHNDLGHFVLHLHGETILCDLGRGVYSRAYFSPTGYDTPHRGSHGHSVPVINSRPQRSGRDAEARILEFVTSESSACLRLELRDAYDDPSLERFERRFDWGGDSLRLRDEFWFAQAPVALEEVFVSLFAPQLEPDGIVWCGTAGKVRLSFDVSAWSPRVDVIQTKAHLGEPLTVYRLVLRVSQLEPYIAFEGRFQLEAGSMPNAAALLDSR
jgi:Heparinase II/III-like protein